MTEPRHPVHGTEGDMLGQLDLLHFKIMDARAHQENSTDEVEALQDEYDQLLDEYTAAFG